MTQPIPVLGGPSHKLVVCTICGNIVLPFKPRRNEPAQGGGLFDELLGRTRCCPVCRYVVYTKKLESVRITSRQLGSECQADENLFTSQYKGKVLIVTGVIKDIGKPVFGWPYVDLDGGEGEKLGIHCQFKENVLREEATYHLRQYVVGDTVTAIGKGESVGSSGYSVWCTLPWTIYEFSSWEPK